MVSRHLRRGAGAGRAGAVAMALVGGAFAVMATWAVVQGEMASDRSHPGGGFTAWLDAEVPPAMSADGVPGMSILVLRAGRPVWQRAYGVADVDSRRPLTEETAVMAHSISKSVSAWGVMKLVEEGRIGLDDPVTRHLAGWNFPTSEFAAREVTVRRLLSNSAGVPLGGLGVEYAPDAPIPPSAATLTGDEVRLQRKPGSAFSYSNAGFGVLELLVEEVTGRDFAEYMEAEVLRPLGMTRSTYAWREDLATSLATGHDLRGQPVAPYLYPYRASGGLFTTLGDLGRFVAAEMEHTAADTSDAAEAPSAAEEGAAIPGTAGQAVPVLSRESLVVLHRPQIAVDGMFGVVADAYGLGHFVETLPDGNTAVWHGGQGHGWMTHFHAVPSTGDGIVIVTNSQRSWPLMARILREWSRDGGFGPVAFGRITTLVRFLWGVVAGLFLGSVFLAWRTAAPVFSGDGRGTPRFPSRSAGLAAGVVGLALLGVLGWAMAQEYLFITSVFPGGTPWLAAGTLALAVILLAFAGVSAADLRRSAPGVLPGPDPPS